MSNSPLEHAHDSPNCDDEEILEPDDGSRLKLFYTAKERSYIDPHKQAYLDAPDCKKQHQVITRQVLVPLY